MGYPNPEQIPLIDDVEFRGICVYVPDTPEYLRALLGSLAGLSQWVNWERDAQQSAIKSANLWKLANNLTVATWANGCGCDDMNCDDLREIIREELENMTISINNTNTNCNCCCGAGGIGTGTDMPPVGDVPPSGTDYPPMPTIPPEDDVPPVDPDEDVDYVAFSCNMSHYMFYLIRQSVLAAVDGFHSTVALRYQAVKDALGFSVRPGGGTAVVDYWQYLLTTFNRESALDVIRQMELNYDDLVCAMSGSYVASERRARFLVVLDAMTISDGQKRLVRFAMSAIEFQSWFNPYDYETVQGLLPASYNGRSCVCGGSVDTGVGLGDAPDGYKWVPIASNMTMSVGSIAYLGDGSWSTFRVAGEHTMIFPGDMTLTTGVYRAYAWSMQVAGVPIEWYRLVVANYMNLPVGVNKYFAHAMGVVANLSAVPIVTQFQMETVARGNRIAYSTTGGTVELVLNALVLASYDADVFPHPSPA